MDAPKDSLRSPGEARVLSKLQPLHQDGRDQRSNQLPRGCRFPSLNEAHRNITGRSLSNGELSLRSASSASSHRLEAKALPSPPLQGVLRHKKHLSPVRRPLDAEDSDLDPIDQVIRQISNPSTPTSLTRPTTVSSHPRNNDGVSPRSATPATPAQSVSPCGETHSTADDCSPDTTPAVHPPHPSSNVDNTKDNKDTTGERVRKQYPSRLSAGAEHAPASRDGAATRLGFRIDAAAKIRPMSDSGNMYSASSASLADRDALVTDRVRVHSLLLASLPSHDSLLYPMPLRVQSMRAEGKHLGGRSGLDGSATGLTTDSDDDPFRYDKEAYKIFLHPSKEREVSAALIHASGLSSHSKATLFGEDELDAVTTQQSPFSLPPGPAPAHVDNRLLLSNCRTRSTTPESNDGFYDSSVIQPNWALEKGAYEVKVVLQDIHPNQTPTPKRCLPTAEKKTDSRAEKRFPTPTARGAANKSLYRAADKENINTGVLSSERDEWETVVTSAPVFKAAGRSAPLGFPLLGSALPDRTAKITGSSVADVSDDSSFCRVPFDEYASTDRIVQHPSGQEDTEESLQIRHMSGTRFPVIVPKQRVHRVNGFAQESSRLFTPPPRPGADTAAALARKVSNPFRQLSGKQGRPLPAPMLLQSLQPHRRDKGRNRFEFRLSQASDCEALCEQDPHDSNDSTGGVQGASSRPPTQGERAGDQDSSFPKGPRSSRSSGSTVHSFAFPLIPLPEAARLQAVQRTGTDADGASGLQYRTANHPHSKSTFPGQPYAAGNSARAATKVHSRKPRKFLLDALSSSSNRLGLPKSSTALSSISSTTAGGTWATIAPFGSTSTRTGAPAQTFKSAVAKLHLGAIAERLKPQAAPQPSFSIGSSTRSKHSGRNTPHLYPWDYTYQQRCWQQQQQQHPSQQRTRLTDPELRAMAEDSLSDDGCGRRGLATDGPHDLEHMGVPLDPDAFLSREARRRRRLWFLCMLAVSLLFPFIALLVYMGKLDNGLSWYTRGEVDRLSVRQRRAILAMAVLQFVLWPSIIVAVVWHVQGV